MELPWTVFIKEEFSVSALLGTDVVVQLGFVVRDVEKTGAKFAEFFGVECPPTCTSGDPNVVKGSYRGEPTRASCRMKFFETPSLQIELIQPDDTPSVWRDFLNEKGEGMHHIAFRVKNTDEAVKKLEEKGYPLLQRGLYANASGQYAYIDAQEDLKMILELLEDFDKTSEE